MIPLMHVDEVQEILGALNKANQISEWGMGGSTTIWARDAPKQCKIVSVDHDKKWFEKVSEEISPWYSDRYTLLLREPSYGRTQKTGIVFEEGPQGLDDYIFPSKDFFDADVYFVDGLARGVCCLATLLKGKKGATVYLHDYAGREDWYNWVLPFFKKHERICQTLLRLKS